MSVIAGYFVATDITVRDSRRRTMTWTLGKSFGTRGPIGPWTVGAALDPSRFPKTDDVVHSEIEGFGRIENWVRAGPPASK